MKYIQLFEEFLNEKYFIEVSVRSAHRALIIIDDMYRKKFKTKGSNYYYTSSEDDAWDLYNTFIENGIEIEDQNINATNESNGTKDSYVLQHELEILIKDAKKNKEKNVARVLQFLKDRIEQSYPDGDVMYIDAKDILLAPQIRKEWAEFPQYMIEDLFESVNESSTKKVIVDFDGDQSNLDYVVRYGRIPTIQTTTHKDGRVTFEIISKPQFNNLLNALRKVGIVTGNSNMEITGKL